MRKKIYVSPSSQINNRYAAGDTNEAVQCRKIAQALVAALQRCGLEAKTNLTGDMYERTAESNKWGADLHLPVHTNAFNSKVQGTRLMAYDTRGNGYKACKAIMETLAPITPGSSDNITANPSLYEVRNTNAPAAYIEVAFHDNREEALWIIANTAQIAEAICEGVCKFFQIDYVPADAGTAKTLYRVQVGAYREADNARAMKEKLEAAGFPAFITQVQE